MDGNSPQQASDFSGDAPIRSPVQQTCKGDPLAVGRSPTLCSKL
jgi:hypothetical protein